MLILKIKQQGSLILESLIAFTIFIIGILGIISLESYFISSGGKSQQRSKAMALADSPNVSCYTVPLSQQAGCGSTVASGYTTSWMNELTSTLPNATATATLNNLTFTVNITWKRNQELTTHNYQATTYIGL
jgi:Tfp pilus assembly protein PilV